MYLLSEDDHHGKQWQYLMGVSTKTIVISSNTLSTLSISCRDLSTHSMCCLLLINTSSQQIRDVDLISCACIDCREMEHMDSSDIGIGILN